MGCESSSYSNGELELNETIGINFYTPDTPEEPTTDNGRRVQLTWAVSSYKYQDTDGVRVRLEANNAENMPNKIFAYLLLPMQPGAGVREGAFSHVCSPTDLAEYPEDDPIPGHRPEWFRLNYIDVHVRSRSEAKALIQDVANDVAHLKATLDTMDTLFPGGAFWIGGPPPDESSQSSQAL